MQQLEVNLIPRRTHIHMEITITINDVEEHLNAIIPYDAVYTRVQEHVNNALRRICNNVEKGRKHA